MLVLVGNALCLDFANTVNVRPNPTRDSLREASTAVEWAAAVAHRLELRDVTEGWMQNAVQLREAITRSVEARIAFRAPEDGDLDVVWSGYRTGLAWARLASTSSGVALRWSDAGPDALLARVSASAVEVLANAPAERLGTCPSCRWLFLDTSRNGSRRWCSMKMCGAREKSRAHYRRIAG